MAKYKWLWTVGAVLAIVGGAVHALQGGFGKDLLTLFGGYSRVVQTIAGVATVVYVVKKQFMK